MKRCPRCGYGNEDGSLFCAECGCRLQMQPQIRNEKKSGANQLLFVIIGIAAALLIGTSVFLATKIFLKEDGPKDLISDTENTGSPQETETAPSKEIASSKAGALADKNVPSEERVSEEQETEEVSDSHSDDESGIHRYELVRRDCTWQEAREDCRQRGGYLARINSYDEYVALVRQIQMEEGFEEVHFYLGGRREDGQTDYYWVNDEDETVGDVLNGGGSWEEDVWMAGEPSYVDGDAQEMYMNLFYYKEDLAWVLNDVPEDVSVYYPGKTGYICEFEN